MGVDGALDPVAPHAAGSHADFRALFEPQVPYAWKTLRRLGVAERDVEDLVHEVLVLAYRRQADYDARRPLRPWLFGIAFRVAADYRRLARHRRELIGEEVEPTEPAPGADAQLEAEQTRRLVLRALDALDLDKRAVVVMHDIDGHPIPEVAAALAIPLNTAYSRLRAGRAELKVAAMRLGARRTERGTA